ncbi:MAG: hypothetical protein HGB11_03325, partial [Chlorobiales bacterium]|nr:hypothetical protein [Chlorobiales bacterium]
LRLPFFSSSLKRLLHVITFLFSINSAFAQQNENHTGFIFYLGVPYTTFTQEAQKTQGIGDAFGVALCADAILYDYLLLGTEFAFIGPKDNSEFINNTTGGERSSTVKAGEFALLAGFNAPTISFSEGSPSCILANFNLGYMWTFLERRSIDDCEGCDVEHLDLNGGLFLNPELYYVYVLNASQLGVAIGVGYKHFFNSDYNSKIELKFSLMRLK